MKEFNIGALIIRIGFGVYDTTIIIMEACWSRVYRLYKGLSK